MTEQLWTQRDLARHYRVTVRTIRRWRKRGRLPEPVTGDGEHPRWRPSEFYIYRDVPGPKNKPDISGHKRTNAKTSA